MAHISRKTNIMRRRDNFLPNAAVYSLLRIMHPYERHLERSMTLKYRRYTKIRNRNNGT